MSAQPFASTFNLKPGSTEDAGVAATRPDHIVQFYENDGYLVQAVADFLTAGLRTGQPVVAIATDAHTQALRPCLRERDIDVEAAEREGQVTFLDAHSTLSTVMVEGMPDEQRFRSTVGTTIENKVRKAGDARVRAYGEMVDVLWKDGNTEAAIRLEELWHDLASAHGFSLLCAYAMANFYTERLDPLYEDVCRRHTHVIPVEAHTQASLQQQTGALQAEIEHRQQLEDALRDALAARRLAEHALREREEELRDFVENAVEGLHWVGPDGVILWANRAELQMLGYSAAEYVGRHIAEFYVDRLAIDDILARLARNEIVRDYEARLRCRDGSVRHVLISANVLWRDGEFVHSRWFTRDITDRKHTEQERRQVEEDRERLAAIVNSSDDAIVGKTLDGIITSWNRGAEEIFGYPAAEAVGRHVSLIIPEERRAEEDDVLASLRRGDKVDHFETERQTRDGRRVNVSLTVSPIRNAEGQIIGASKIARDITEQKRAHEALEKAVRARDEFLSIAGHELRNPLNALQLQLVGLLRAAQERSKSLARDWVCDRVRQAADDVNRLVRLAHNLLDVSRITSGPLDLEPEDVDLKAIITTVVDRLRPQLTDGQLSLDVEETPGYWDRLRLEQIVGNLLSNAIKYGDGKPIEISLKADADRAYLVVTDHGIGIDVENQKKLFGRFERAVSRRDYGGFGLGLWITRNIVDAMGGEISVQSRVGEGSTFRVTLPRQMHLPDSRTT
jgi:PAS domain S-box-containing protein